MSTINHVSGKKYRILKDAVNKIWDEISFVTDASDCIATDGQSLQDKVGDIKGLSTTSESSAGYVLDSQVAAIKPTTLTATLAAGATSLSFTDSAISSTAKIEIFSNLYGLSPKTAIVSGTTLTLTFDEQESAVTIKVQVSSF